MIYKTLHTSFHKSCFGLIMQEIHYLLIIKKIKYDVYHFCGINVLQ
jgi:hypothetical protein